MASEDVTAGDAALVSGREAGLKALPKLLVTTQPKAGTYLISEILVGLGYHQSYYHLSQQRMEAYDRTELNAATRHPEKYRIAIPFEQSVRLVRRGEFAAAHLPPSLAVLAPMPTEMKAIACVRDLRKSLVSHARFYASANRVPKLAAKIRKQGVIAFLEARGEKSILQAVHLDKWRQQENCLHFRFEDIFKMRGEAVSRIARFVGAPCEDPEAIFQRALDTPTLTSSEEYIKLEWGAKEEALFRRLGGEEANRKLGYAPVR